MKPTDFLKTAEFLKDHKDEWHVRTSINRSYYGLFLHLRDFLSGQGIKVPTKSTHKFVLDCFHKSRFFDDAESKSSKGVKKRNGRTGDKVIWGISKRLRSLLQARVDADYKLHLTIPPNDSKHNLELATTAIQEFEKLRGSDREKHIVKVANEQEKLRPL